MTEPDARASLHLAPHCERCKTGDTAPVNIAFAFQPIVDITHGSVYAHEALVRGPNGESAASMLAQVDEANRYRFDQHCRTTAIAQAAAMGMDTRLSINFMPNAVYDPAACISRTLQAAHACGFPIERIIFETVEGESIADCPHLVQIFREYKALGFQTAIDDFGAGASGLTLLADFQPDLIKLDIALVRGIDTDAVRQCIVSGVCTICCDLGIRIVAEGVETMGERDFLKATGISLMQGYLFAKPAFKALPSIANLS